MKNKEPKQIIVIGIYRSGTSLIGGVLDKLGIDVGNHAELADYNNPWGYYEDTESITLNSKLRDMCGKIFYNVDKTDISKVIDDPTANELVKTYIKNRDKNGTWGLKDPKLVPFFDLWMKYLKNPYFIFIRRNRDSIVGSWQKMKDRENPKHIEDAHDNHLEMILDIREKVKEKYPWMELDYGWHTEHPTMVSQRIADFLDIPNNEEAIEFGRRYSLSGKK